MLGISGHRSQAPVGGHAEVCSEEAESADAPQSRRRPSRRGPAPRCRIEFMVSSGARNNSARVNQVLHPYGCFDLAFGLLTPVLSEPRATRPAGKFKHVCADCSSRLCFLGLRPQRPRLRKRAIDSWMLVHPIWKTLRKLGSTRVQQRSHVMASAI